MTDSVVISIDRTSLSLSALTLSTSYATDPLTITTYTRPTITRRNVYAPQKDWLNGQVQTANPIDQGVIGFTAEPTAGVSESSSQGAIADLVAALGQFAYTITVTENGVASTYQCDSGTVVPSARTVANLRYSNPPVTVTVPCYPVAS